MFRDVALDHELVKKEVYFVSVNCAETFGFSYSFFPLFTDTL